jgi:hypothetical protein
MPSTFTLPKRSSGLRLIRNRARAQLAVLVLDWEPRQSSTTRKVENRRLPKPDDLQREGEVTKVDGTVFAKLG